MCSPSGLTYCIKLAMSLTYADTVVTSQSRVSPKKQHKQEKHVPHVAQHSYIFVRSAHQLVPIVVLTLYVGMIE